MISCSSQNVETNGTVGIQSRDVADHDAVSADDRVDVLLLDEPPRLANEDVVLAGLGAPDHELHLSACNRRLCDTPARPSTAQASPRGEKRHLGARELAIPDPS